jgi:insulysin
MKDFFMYYMSPSSPHRAKLSVHLIAQKRAKELTLAEKKDRASTILATIFKESNITPNDDALKTRIDSISSEAAIPSAISAHLKDDLTLAADQVEKITDEAMAALGLADSGLSGEVVLADDAMTITGVQGGRSKEPVLITDVHAWKAGLPMSTGVRPVRNLEEFMEDASKL